MFCKTTSERPFNVLSTPFIVSTTVNVRTPLPLYVGEGEEGVHSKGAWRGTPPRPYAPGKTTKNRKHPPSHGGRSNIHLNKKLTRQSGDWHK